MDRIITVDEIMTWTPCEAYPRSRVAKIIGDGKTPLEMLDLDIPPEDRLWLVLRADVIPARELRLLACDFAAGVLPIFESEYPNDRRPREAIETARRYAIGDATWRQMDAAWAAARAASDASGAASDASGAARAAASNAALAAARDAAWAAARAASDTASDAAWAAALAAASDAASNAARAASDTASDAAWAAARTAASDRHIEITRRAISEIS